MESDRDRPTPADNARTSAWPHILHTVTVRINTSDPTWRRRALARTSAPPPDAPWKLDPWDEQLGKWEIERAEPKHHTQVLLRLERRAAFQPFDPVTMLEAVRGVVEGDQARGLTTGQLSLHDAVGLAEKLTIDEPAAPSAVERREFEAWGELEWWPRWWLWNLASDLPGSPLDRYDFDFLDNYTMAYNALAKHVLRAEQERKSLRQMLERKFPKGGLLRAPYPWPDDGQAVETRESWMHQHTFTLPRDWRTRWTITKRGEFAEALATTRYAIGITAVKRRLTRERAARGLALTWQRYRVWLAAHRDARDELADALRLPLTPLT